MANIPPGSYQETSRDISFEGVPGETDCYLIATCQTADGQWVESKLKYDIANCNGQLKWAPDGCYVCLASPCVTALIYQRGI